MSIWAILGVFLGSLIGAFIMIKLVREDERQNGRQMMASDLERFRRLINEPTEIKKKS